MLVLRQERLDADQTEIIQETVKDRFKIFLELPLSVGFIGADFFKHEKINHGNFGENLSGLMRFNKDILGVNLIDHTGHIIQVFPYETNKGALGKRTQNFNNIKKSLDAGEAYFLSAPFDLFQKSKGFVFYIPIKTKSELKGWIAPVVSMGLFDEKFQLRKFSKSYELIILDEESNLPYFSTAMTPENGTRIYSSSATIFGRKLVFQSWRKKSANNYDFPWQWTFVASFILGLLSAWMVNLYEEKKKARRQLQDIGIILRLTAKEALGRLVELQGEAYKLESPENIAYITNLIEQIDLLQTMAISGEGISEVQEFLPVLENEIETFREIFRKKDLKMTYHRETLKDIKIEVNSWLMKNCVLANILTHSIIYADPGSEIELDYKSTEHSHFFTFHTRNIHYMGPDRDVTLPDRRMEVARKALQIYGGELFVQYDLSGGLIMRILLPI